MEVVRAGALALVAVAAAGLTLAECIHQRRLARRRFIEQLMAEMRVELVAKMVLVSSALVGAFGALTVAARRAAESIEAFARHVPQEADR